MCRTKIHGGRQCPCRQTPEYKARAAARRRSNRAAKKNLKTYLESQGMTDTAAHVASIKPSQIPAFLAAIGADNKVIGVDMPGASAGVKDGSVEADAFVKTAAKEAKKRGVTFAALVGDGPESGLDNGETEFFKKYDSLPGKEYREAVAVAILNEYIDNGDSALHEYISGIDVGKFGDWKTIETEIFRVAKEGEFPNEEKREVLRKLKKNVENMSNSPSWPEGENMWNEKNGVTVDKFKEDDSSWKSWENGINLFSVYGQKPEVGLFLSAVKSGKKVEVMPLAGGLCAARVRGIESEQKGTVLVYRPIPHLDGFQAFRGNRDSYCSINEEDFNKLFTPKGELKATAGMTEEEKKLLFTDGKITTQRLRGDDEEFKKHFNDRQIQMSQALKQNLQPLSNSYSIARGNSYLQQRFPGNYNLVGADAKQRQAFFNKGTAMLHEKDPQRPKELKNAYDLILAKNTIAAKGLAKAPHITKKALKAEAMAAKKLLTKEEKVELLEYTGAGYSQYGYAAISGDNGYNYYGYGHKKFSNIERIDNAIKRVEKSNTTPRILYRGYKTPGGMEVKDYLDSLEIGATFKTTRIMSTTSNPEIANNFAHAGVKEVKSVVMVYLPTTKGVALTNGTSEYADKESEVVMGVGDKYTVVDKVFDSDSNTAYVYVAGDDYVPTK